jgi:SNF2 family DNA or RNA helicase
MTLSALRALKAAKKLKAALVIAPLRVAHMVWPAEAEKWTDFHGLKVVVLHGKDKDRLLVEPADVYIINPEGLPWLFQQRLLPDWCTLVVDESTKFKSWRAQRTKLLRSQLNRFQRRWILTGTPAPNGIEDLFSQIFICDAGQALGRFITHFRSRYMVQTGYMGYDWAPKEGAVEEIEERIRHLVIRLDAADWLKLPKLIHNRIVVELPSPVQELYKQLEREFFVQLKTGAINAATAATAGIKLRQLVGGQVYDETRQVHAVHEAKIDALEDLLEELGGQPLLVAVAFLPEVLALRERFGKVPYLGGGVSRAEAQATVDGWNSGKHKLVLAHPASVSHGLNLQGGRHVCWYNLTWNLEEYDQFIRRVWRQGQKRQVVCHSIVAADTIDVDIERALRNKKKLMQSLLDAMK